MQNLFRWLIIKIFPTTLREEDSKVAPVLKEDITKVDVLLDRYPIERK